MRPAPKVASKVEFAAVTPALPSLRQHEAVPPPHALRTLDRAESRISVFTSTTARLRRESSIRTRTLSSARLYSHDKEKDNAKAARELFAVKLQKDGSAKLELNSTAPQQSSFFGSISRRLGLSTASVAPEHAPDKISDPILQAFAERITSMTDRKLPPFSIMSSSAAYGCWELVIAVTLCSSLILAPFTIAFADAISSAHLGILRGVNVALDATLIFQVLLSIVVIRSETQHYPGSDFAALARLAKSNILRAEFALNLVASLPLDRALDHLLILKLLRLPCLFTVFPTLYHRCFPDVTLLPVTLLFVSTLVSYPILLHWGACAWYYSILSLEPKAERLDWASQRAAATSHEAHYLWTSYINCLYNAAFVLAKTDRESDTMTAVELSIHLAFSAVFVVLMIVIIGCASCMVHTAFRDLSQFEGDLATQLRVMNRHSLTDELKLRVLKFQRMKWRRIRGLTEQQFLSQLSPALAKVVRASIHQKMLMAVRIFAASEPSFMLEMASKLTFVVYMSGDVIFRLGDPANEMFFIRAGTVHIANEKEAFARVLTVGAYFGEIALVFETNRSASALCASFCEMYVLSKNDMRELFVLHPHEEFKMQVVARARMANQGNDKTNTDRDVELVTSTVKTIDSVQTLPVLHCSSLDFVRNLVFRFRSGMFPLEACSHLGLLPLRARLCAPSRVQAPRDATESAKRGHLPRRGRSCLLLLLARRIRLSVP